MAPINSLDLLSSCLGGGLAKPPPPPLQALITPRELTGLLATGLRAPLEGGFQERTPLKRRKTSRFNSGPGHTEGPPWTACWRQHQTAIEVTAVTWNQLLRPSRKATNTQRPCQSPGDSLASAASSNRASLLALTLYLWGGGRSQKLSQERCHPRRDAPRNGQ